MSRHDEIAPRGHGRSPSPHRRRVAGRHARTAPRAATATPTAARAPVTREGAHAARAWLGARVVGAGLLAATGVIHFDLYQTGYRTIPTIGWLFLLQVISALSLAGLLLVTGSRLAALAGAGLSLSTLLGYLVSLRVSLFGFREVRTSSGVAAGIVEVLGVAVLAGISLRPVADGPGAWTAQRQWIGPALRWIAGVLALQAAVALGVSLANASPVAPHAGPPGAQLKAGSVHGVAVVTDQHGYTLYWFAPDSSTTSSCYATCASYWPPVLGRRVAGPGVTGTVGVISRRGGALQATYDHHPLYTYVGDSAPGQATGDHVNLNGGFWYEMKVSG